MNIETLVIEVRKPPFEIEFKCYEYVGCQLLREEDQQPIKEEEALKVGDRVLCFDQFVGVVAQQLDGVLYVDGPDFMCSLEFGKDDRECWVASTLGCKRALDRIDIR